MGIEMGHPEVAPPFPQYQSVSSAYDYFVTTFPEVLKSLRPCAVGWVEQVDWQTRSVRILRIYKTKE